MLKPQTRCGCSQIFRSNKMEVWDGVKRRQAGAQIQLGLCMVTVLHLILGGSFNVVSGGTNVYWTEDLDALQSIWGAWNVSTPELASNLAGWSSNEIEGVSSIYPCQSLSNPDATVPNWRGVFCLKTNFNATDNSSFVQISALSLHNASIVGTLPEAIGNLTAMGTLELTGNPRLTGPLPGVFWNMWLNILDVHDNGFSGPLPDEFIYSWNILQFDVSGNHFTGGYPFKQTSTMDYLQKLSIAHNQFVGEIPIYAFENKTELEILDISSNYFVGELPDLNPMSRSLTHLDVSGNEFQGQLPDMTPFSKLITANFGDNNFVLRSTPLLDFLWKVNASSTSLVKLNLSYNHLASSLSSWADVKSNKTPTFGQELYLDNNTLWGTLNISKLLEWGLLKERLSDRPGSQVPAGQRLSIMSLRNNNISHVVSSPYAIGNTTTMFILQGNPYCDNYNPDDDSQRCYCTQYCFITPAKLRSDRRKTAIIASVGSVLAVVLISLGFVGAILLKNKRYKQYLLIQFEKKFEEFNVKPTIFPYNDLKAATRDFHDDMKLGQGGYGAVYKGILSNGNVVAVKQLHNQHMHVGMDEFLNEVVLITGMKHRNLVNLKGCCLRENQRLLVYEYVDNYDVEHIILGSKKEVLSWPVRLKICVGVARGLHYLHALAQPRVIHRDIKAANVLLDKNLEPKIADFGLALLFPDEHTHIMTVHVAGTKGYLAPEYASLGQLSDKVDVYSFGVLCLEIISGRRNIVETAPLEQVYLPQWAWRLYEADKLVDLVDSSLELSDEEMRDVERVIKVCLLCIQHSAENRPCMDRIVHLLQNDTESDVQVLHVSKGKQPSFESLMSQKLGDCNSSTGLESVMEGSLLSDRSYTDSYQAVDSLGKGRV